MFKNEIYLSGKALKDSERKGSGPWRFCLVQGGGKKKDGSGFWLKEYFQCECWPNVVEGGDKVRAGEVVYVEGRLRYHEWQATNGERRRGHSIVCSVVRPHTDEPKLKPLTPQSYTSLEITDADIPF